MKITFLPPPMEGTLSLGIYDRTGKLVRVLRKEATEKEFTIGLNGLITTWDGKDDNGATLPAGKYAARGYSVGRLDIQGVAIHGNDWITEDETGPRIRRVETLRLGEDGSIEAVLTRTDDTTTTRILASPMPEAKLDQPAARAEVEGEKVFAVANGKRTELPMDEGEAPVAASAGYGDEVWVIVKTAEGRELRAYGINGEFIRRLGYAPGDPLPVSLVASPSERCIAILEENETLQRVRLMRGGGEKATPQPTPDDDTPKASVWEVSLERVLWKTPDFASIAGMLGRETALQPVEKVKLRLLPNTLLQNAAADIEVRADVSPQGCVLRTVDGLPLRTLTETPNLVWTVLVREQGRTLSLFQSDGTSVEEFRLARLGQMMAFDAGDYEWKPPREN